jgi:hypothetical protein
MPEASPWRRARKPQPDDHDAVLVYKKNGKVKVVWWLAVKRLFS